MVYIASKESGKEYFIATLDRVNPDAHPNRSGIDGQAPSAHYLATRKIVIGERLFNIELKDIDATSEGLAKLVADPLPEKKN
jgi:hypothetical protein